MKVPKFEHYVPRFYLERFVDQEGFIWVFDKTQGRTFRVKPKNIAGQNCFYDLPKLEQFGGARTLMEHQFADLESEAQKISDCWLRQGKERGHVEIPEPNRDIMPLFLTLQLLRTAEIRTVLLQFVQLLQRTGDTSHTYDAAADAQALHGALLWDDDLIKTIREKIADCVWLFAFNDSK